MSNKKSIIEQLKELKEGEKQTQINVDNVKIVNENNTCTDFELKKEHFSEKTDNYLTKENMSTTRINILVKYVEEYIVSLGVETNKKFKELCDLDTIKEISFDYMVDRFIRIFFQLQIGQDKLNQIIENTHIEYDKPLNRLTERLYDTQNVIFNIQEFKRYQPFVYDKSGMFWFWNFDSAKYEKVDEVDVMNSIDKAFRFNGYTVKSKIRTEYIEAMKRIGRINAPKEPSKKWVQFKSIIFDIENNKKMAATPEYFICNPIPYELGFSSDTPTLDKLFKQWVGEEYVDTLYEVLAYCTIIDYPIHLIICLTGCGRNGKSTFINFLIKFIGKENCTSTELDDLVDSRFETCKLYKKLVCTLGETNFEVMQKTSKIKKLVGQDMVGFEFKNKTPFDDFNYAKVIIASNALPISEDTSEGFYRRWLIIDFPNRFPEGKDILDTIPVVEYNNLARKCCDVLPKLLLKGMFTNQGSVEQRQEKYILASNPFPKFMDLCCEHGNPSYCIRQQELKNAYTQYLLKNKKRVVSWKGFKEAIEREGYFVENTSKMINSEWIRDKFVIGICLKNNWKELILTTPTTLTTDISTLFPYREKSSEMSRKSRNSSENNNILTDFKQNVEVNEEKIIESPEQVVIKRCNYHKEWEVTEDFENIVEVMKKEGKLFEVRPGVVKLLN